MGAERSAGSSALEALVKLRGSPCPVFAPGEVWLVGAGPGDPGLLTLDALAAILQADVILYDALVNSNLLNRARADAEKVFVGKRGGHPSTSQEVIIDLLLKSAARNKRVLRLKSGDPFLFARGGEEMLALAAAGVPCRVIPGITSGLAALACAAIPATMRGVNQAVVLTTGHAANDQEAGNWVEFARRGVPIVFYMALRNLQSILTKLIEGGISATLPAAVIASATLPEQGIVVSTLTGLAAEAEAAHLQGPAVVVVGEIVRVRSELLKLASDLQNRAPQFAPHLDCSCADC
jgi:uroporphyrin-III C-methyltransferase